MPQTSTRSKSRTRPASARRGSRVGAPRRRRWLARWLVRLTAAGGATAAGLLGWAALERHFAPTANTHQDHFDAIVVLGAPADSDGNPTPAQLARVTEAVREYERGVAPRLILTGGAVANRYVEASVMARAAEAQGVPEAAMLLDPHALDTIENACNATRIMRANGWTSAEVISSRGHLPRVGLILSRLPIAWRTHAAPSLGPESREAARSSALLEIIKTAHYLVWARWRERCE